MFPASGGRFHQSSSVPSVAWPTLMPISARITELAPWISRHISAAAMFWLKQEFVREMYKEFLTMLGWIEIAHHQSVQRSIIRHTFATGNNKTSQMYLFLNNDVIFHRIKVYAASQLRVTHRCRVMLYPTMLDGKMTHKKVRGPSGISFPPHNRIE